MKIEMKTLEVPVKQIETMKTDPRKSESKEDHESLVHSIDALGLLQPILVSRRNGKFVLRAGSRRLKACKALGMEKIPVVVVPDDDASEAVTVAENLQRVDLPPLDEAAGIARLIKLGWTIDTVATQIGKSPSFVARRASLVKLSDRWSKLTADPKSNVSTWPAAMLEVVSRFHEKKQDEFLSQNIHKRVHDKNDLLYEVSRFMMQTAGAPWKLDDETMKPVCQSCQKRSCRQPFLFEDAMKGSKDDYCLDDKCWANKSAEHAKRKLVELKAKYPAMLKLRGGSDWENKQKLLTEYEVEKCKKNEKGARMCVVATGSDAGKHYWGRLLRGAKEGKAKGGKTLADREEQLKVRRLRATLQDIQHEISKVVRAGKEPLVVDSDLVMLAACFGTFSNATAPGPRTWKKFHDSKKAEARKALWASTLNVFYERLRMCTINPVVAEMKEVCKFLSIDYEKIWTNAVHCNAEPASWLKERKVAKAKKA